MPSILVGPIHSRRLGRSLGINLFPDKICSLDCVYCEAGKTANLTTERKPYTPTDVVIAELSRFLQASPKLDYITFSGIGEPVLHSGIGEIIRYIKQNWPQYKLCLITNSTLLTDEGLHDDLALCDLTMPSLDAVSDDVFQKIDRPFRDLRTSDIIDGLTRFRKKSVNQMWLEIFFIEGLNDTADELALLKQACEKISPDKIQINSLDRRGLFDWVKKMPEKRLHEIKDFFKPLIAEIV